jgi:hypothetical protein
MSDESGGFNQEIKLPADLDYGFHTIHIVGKSYSGENIELYQSISYYNHLSVVESQNESRTTATNQSATSSVDMDDSLWNEILLSVDNNASAATQDGLKMVQAVVKGASVGLLKDEHPKQAADKNLAVYVAGIVVFVMCLVFIIVKYRG